MPTVVIINANQHMWDLVRPIREMVATKPGRRLNPTLKFSVTGLDALKMYKTELKFPRSQFKYKFKEARWQPWRAGEAELPDRIISLQASSGADLMRFGADFSKLTICTPKGTESYKKIKLQSQYVYYPKLVITAVEDPSEVYEYSDDTLKFVVVTDSRCVRSIKLKLNEKVGGTPFNHTITTYPLIPPQLPSMNQVGLLFNEQDETGSYLKLQPMKFSIGASDEFGAQGFLDLGTEQSSEMQPEEQEEDGWQFDNF